MLSLAIPHYHNAPVYSPPHSPTDRIPSPHLGYAPAHYYPPPSFDSASGAPQYINRAGQLNPCYSNSPSPIHQNPSLSSDSALPRITPSQNSQDRFLHSGLPDYPPEDREPPYHQELASDKYQAPILDQRRMSEPAALSGQTLYATPTPVDPNAPTRYQQFSNFAFNPPALDSSSAPRSSASALYPLHRGASTGSLRDLRHHHFQYPPTSQQPEWKLDDPRQRDQYYEHRADGLDERISPMQPNFSGGLLGSPPSGMPYSPISENPYGPSPPGTGTSTSSSVAPLSSADSPSRSFSQNLQRSLSSSNAGADSMDRKTYSFVALPGNAVKKRPRRRYEEIERLYQCSWPDCNKSYGTLNHLNAHVTMQKHGSKRSPNEFKELRKQWRKAKKEQEAVALAMRRDSYSDGYDELSGYNHRYLASQAHAHSLHQQQHRPHSSHLDLPSSVTIGRAERYSVAIDEIRYPPERDDSGAPSQPPGLDVCNYDSSTATMTARQRYSGGMPTSWHGASTLATRPNVQLHQEEIYSSSSLPNQPQQHAHHSQLPQLAISNRASSPASARGSLTRGLPQNSTLLTPLPGYQTVPLIQPLQNGSGAGYAREGYELYDDGESSGRPGTGHTNVSVGHGQASGDEYSQ